ncbi:MAG: DUF177 domain-containing protein [Chlorobi bacterium]|nr:DUF177 domain-containing protein [Chlorobiota bacterium]
MIPFRGLKEGEHIFNFAVTDRFFDAYGSISEVHRGNITVEIKLIRESRMMTLNFILTGAVRIQCDRCLDLFDQPVDSREQLLVRFGSAREELAANILVVPEKDGVLDIQQYIYEYIHLALPLKRVHPDDTQGNSTCNPEMLNMLDKLVPHIHHNSTDPRWSALKDLKNFN